MAGADIRKQIAAIFKKQPEQPKEPEQLKPLAEEEFMKKYNITEKQLEYVKELAKQFNGDLEQAAKELDMHA